MLDNTVIVYMSCSSGDHHCTGYDPFVLLEAGQEVKMGRYLEYPNMVKGHRTVSSLYISLMQAGMSTGDSFGQADANLRHLVNGPLSEIMA